MITFGQTTDRKVRTFSLQQTFIDNYRGRQPEWGPIGYFTYKRTYARELESGKTEEFWQTCQRVVEGVYNVQKIHCRGLNLPWSEPKAQKSAQEMYSRMWDFKWLPPGRGLWMMGSKFIEERTAAGLFNCAFRSTRDLST